MLLFGIIEFGWGFAQYLDVRHGTREGARLAAVNFQDPATVPPAEGSIQTAQIVAELCDRMGGDSIGATVALSFDTAGAEDLGDEAVIEVNSELDTLTGFLDFALSGVDINDEISFRLERDATWDATTSPVACT